MTELMKGGPHFVMGQQRRLPLQRLRNVQMIRHYWFGPEQSTLLDVGSHPRPTPFGRPRIIIPEKQRQRLTIGVKHFPHPDVRMINRKIVALLEGQAVEFSRGKENAIG